jgi:hypothetical protein
MTTAGSPSGAVQEAPHLRLRQHVQLDPRSECSSLGPSAVPPSVREYIQFPPFDSDHLEHSLRHLAKLAE